MPDLWMDVDAALSEVPVNIMPLLDDTDFKTRETAVAYNAAGMDLVWNFVTTAGAYTQTAVTPTTGGNYDWTHQGDGMYSIEIPASGGASINNDTEGFGWFTGVATGVLPWRGPIIGFRAAGLNNALIDDAHSATRGLAGTALPAVAAGSSGGLGTIDANLRTLANVDAWLGTQPNTLQSGRVDGYVGAFLAGVIDAAAIGTGAIDADALATDAITAAKIAAGAITSSEAPALANLDVAVSTRAAPGDAMALTGAAVDAIHDEVIEGSLTFRQIERILLAAVAGLVTVAGAVRSFRDQANTKNRISGTEDDDGQRSGVSVDGT